MEPRARVCVCEREGREREREREREGGEERETQRDRESTRGASDSPFSSARPGAPYQQSVQQRERETTGYEPFALHAPIQWAVQSVKQLLWRVWIGMEPYRVYTDIRAAVL